LKIQNARWSGDKEHNMVHCIFFSNIWISALYLIFFKPELAHSLELWTLLLRTLKQWTLYSTLKMRERERERERERGKRCCMWSIKQCFDETWKVKQDKRQDNESTKISYKYHHITIFKSCHSSTVASRKCSFMFEVIFM